MLYIYGSLKPIFASNGEGSKKARRKKMNKTIKKIYKNTDWDYVYVSAI